MKTENLSSASVKSAGANPQQDRQTTVPIREWWCEPTADEDWAIGSGIRGFALVDNETMAMLIRDAHNSTVSSIKAHAERLAEALTEVVEVETRYTTREATNNARLVAHKTACIVLEDWRKAAQ